MRSCGVNTIAASGRNKSPKMGNCPMPPPRPPRPPPLPRPVPRVPRVPRPLCHPPLPAGPGVGMSSSPSSVPDGHDPLESFEDGGDGDWPGGCPPPVLGGIGSTTGGGPPPVFVLLGPPNGGSAPPGLVLLGSTTGGSAPPGLGLLGATTGCRVPPELGGPVVVVLRGFSDETDEGGLGGSVGP
jgi:hypothetical protein